MKTVRNMIATIMAAKPTIVRTTMSKATTAEMNTVRRKTKMKTLKTKMKTAKMMMKMMMKMKTLQV